MHVIERKPDPDVPLNSLEFAKFLRALAADIEAGKVTACACVSVGTDGFVTTHAEYPKDRFMMLGGLTYLSARVTSAIAES